MTVPNEGDRELVSSYAVRLSESVDLKALAQGERSVFVYRTIEFLKQILSDFELRFKGGSVKHVQRMFNLAYDRYGQMLSQDGNHTAFARSVSQFGLRLAAIAHERGKHYVTPAAVEAAKRNCSIAFICRPPN